MSYDGVNVKDLDVLKPTEGATPPSELNGSDREIKTVLKNQFAIATKTAAYTLLGSDSVILANGTFAITLPTASTVAGGGYKKEYIIINIGTGIVTITGTVDGASNPTLTTQYSSITIETDGTNYYSVKTNPIDKLFHDVTLSGTDTYVGTLPYGILDYQDKVKIAFVVPNANTLENPTINLSSKGAKKVFYRSGTTIGAGGFPVGKAICEYDSSADIGSGGWIFLNDTMVDGYHAGNSSGQVPVSNGTVCTDLNADKVDNYHAGNSSGQVPVSNGTVCTDLNADKVDNYHAGNSSGQVPVSDGTVCSNLNADMVDGAHYGGTTIKVLASNVILATWNGGGIPYLNYNEYGN